MTYDDAKATALECAHSFDTDIYVAECAIYAISENEFGEGDFIIGSADVFRILFPRLHDPGYKGRLVGVASPDGNFFCNDLNLLITEFRKP